MTLLVFLYREKKHTIGHGVKTWQEAIGTTLP